MAEVDEELIAEVLSTATGIPVFKLTEAETARLGFKRAIVPMGSDLKIAGIEILEASRVEQAISKVKIN